MMVTVAPAAPASVPRLHLTTPPRLTQLPCDEMAETKLTEAGRKLETVTAVAAEGPLLVTVMV